MDLVLMRAEAANTPIHSFGYGRSYDPASLWLMSNHTNGTYTFVNDWYDLPSHFHSPLITPCPSRAHDRKGQGRTCPVPVWWP
ncbi:hypothetical protein V8E52_001581 [Russula decolorans]